MLNLEKSFENNNVSKKRYLYNGKELQDQVIGGMALGWYEARCYDSELGRWHSKDPHAEKYIEWSAYIYGNDNPIRFIDINGNDAVILIAKYGANGMGHMAAVIQDGKGNCYTRRREDEKKKEEEKKAQVESKN